MPGRKAAAQGHQAVYAALLVLRMQREEMGLQLQKRDNLILYSSYKNIPNTLQVLMLKEILFLRQ